MRSGIDLPAPPAPMRRDHGGSGWIRLTRAANEIDAHLLTGRMGEAGVETRLVKDGGAPGTWLYGGSNPWAPVTVLVRRFQYDEARVVLAEIAYEAPAIEPEEMHATRPARGPVAWWAVAILLGIIFTLIGLARTAGMLEQGRGSCGAPLVCRGAP